MKYYTGLLISSLLLLLLMGSSISNIDAGKKQQEEIKEIIACGDDQVVIIDSEASNEDDIHFTWQWKVSEATDLPAKYRKLMVPTDDCKPVDGNSKLLITSSGGGVVLVDKKTKKSLFYAHVPNAHSAEYLPGNRIVVALSTAEGGNSIALYDIDKPDERLFEDSLYSGHGVTWIPARERIFALGYDELRAYALQDWDTEKPGLRLVKAWTLPQTGGHDLMAVTDDKLLLSTTDGVWAFNIAEEKFAPFALLKDVPHVKSVNYDEVTHALVYTKAEISWWTHHIYFKNPDKKLYLPDINLYKVRVMPE